MPNYVVLASFNNSPFKPICNNDIPCILHTIKACKVYSEELLSQNKLLPSQAIFKIFKEVLPDEAEQLETEGN